MECVLFDLEELGGIEFLVLTDPYNIEIFSCCLRLLPFYSSTFHQTNAESLSTVCVGGERKGGERRVRLK